MERHSVSRLVGAPPGYVGYNEGGQLTEAVRRHPYCVILFDEFEKAHQDVANILLQMLDDGRVTDAQGRTVSFKNTVIIMTSNLGSEYLLNGLSADGEIRENAKDMVMEALRSHARPEFLNRVDDIILFKPLSVKQIEKIVDLLLDNLRKRLAEKNITIDLTERARFALAREGYDPNYGARPLRRLIQRKVETAIARAIISGTIEDGEALLIDFVDGEYVVDQKPQVPAA
jgi:ATP-dependent Clp protease ATP-binding subunit ClpB